MNNRTWLDDVHLDWGNFTEASKVARQVLERIAGNRDLLGSLVLAASKSERLRELAEKHNELNYIVIYDALDRGFRLRLHRFSKGLEDIPHNHRFSFASAILAGSYVHTLFELDEVEASDPRSGSYTLDQPPGSKRESLTPVRSVRIDGITPILSTRQAAGSVYALQHRAIHKTAMPDSDAFSLFIRGPAEKECSLQLQPERETYRWKFGRMEETDEVVADRIMTPAEYKAFLTSLEEANVL